MVLVENPKQMGANEHGEVEHSTRRSNYCSWCGKEIGEEEQGSDYCSGCGNTLYGYKKGGSNYCIRCGIPLRNEN